MAISARIDELRKKFDENPRRYFAPLANEYRKSGDPAQAIFICETYLPQQPGHMSGHIVFGQALYEVNRFDEARAVFETALTLDPENLIALRHLGDIARQSGDNEAAHSWYQRVLEADPRNDEIAQILSSLAAESNPTPPRAANEREPQDEGRVASSSALSLEAAAPPDLRARTARDLESQGMTPLERFDAGLNQAEPILPPPVFDATTALPTTPHEQASADPAPMPTLRLSGPIARVADRDAAAPAPFANEESPLSARPVEMDRIDILSSFHESFEADSLAITAQPDSPTAPPAGSNDDAAETTPEESTQAESKNAQSGDDDGDLGGAFDDSEFEPFNLGTPVPLPEPSFGQSTAESSNLALDAGRTSGSDEPPPLPFVEMSTIDAIVADLDEPLVDASVNDAGDADIDDELETFLARHTAQFQIPNELAPPAADDGPAATVPSSMEIVGAEATTSEGVTTAPTEVADGDVPETDLGNAEFDTPSTVAETPSQEEPKSADAADATDSLDTGARVSSVDPAGDSEPVAATSESETIAPATDSEEAVHAAAEGDTAESSEVDAETAVVPPEPERETPPPVPVDAFATETMAELYLQQGHPEPALEIYQKLVGQRPNDPQLKERLSAIERRMFGTPPSAAARPVDPASDEPARAAQQPEPSAPVGPTIREFLAALATRGNDAAEQPGHDEASGVGYAPESDGDATEEALGHASTGSIDGLFSGGQTAERDASAATVLAAAFAGEEADVPALFDRGGHVASAEHAERRGRPVEVRSDGASDSPPGPTSGGGFSFDQFFAGDSQSAAPPPTKDVEPAPGDAKDVAQFNQWLSGLKKPS